VVLSWKRGKRKKSFAVKGPDGKISVKLKVQNL
jgi:hypothetical protein